MLYKGRNRIKDISTDLLLFGPMLIYKLACDVGYWVLISWNTEVYSADFNSVKFCIGLLWCIVLYFAIDLNGKKASAFLLYFFFLLQIIPITTLYSLGNDNSVYYNTVCLAVLLCELFVRFLNSKAGVIRKESLSVLMIFGIVGLTLLLLVQMIRIYGKPNSTALNFYNVYDLRASSKSLGKLMNYLLSWTMAVFLPLFMARSVVGRKYLFTALCCAVFLLIYLYTGHKTYLFAAPLVLVVSVWSGRPDSFREFFLCFCAGVALLVILALIEIDKTHGLLNRIFSYFVRRSMFVPANNKFKYYDYFSTHPKLGIYGIFPRKLVPVNSVYENIPYTYEISRIYYGKPEMNSNTGFLAEGYMRFGHFGTFFVLFLFSVILKLIDRFAERTSYQLAVGFFSYAVFSLADAHLIDSLFFGPWMFLVLILLFYKGDQDREEHTVLSPSATG